LLSTLFDYFNKVSVHFCTNSSRFMGNETAEVAGIAVEGENADEASDRKYVRSSCPFAKSGFLIEAMGDSCDDFLEVSCEDSA
jgi:hypothetical protein